MTSFSFKNLTNLLCILFFMFQLTSQSNHYDDLKMTFEEFLTKFKKPQLTQTQYLKRQQIFYQNIAKLKKLIQEQGCESCGITKFYDETQDQFRNHMGLIIEEKKFAEHVDKVANSNFSSQNQENSNLKNTNKILVSATPSNKNWVDEKKITSIKNQGKCGTCWSFATAAAIESSMIIKGKFFSYLFYQPDLSEQYLLNCASIGTCSGGYLQESIDLAFSKGIPYEYDMPYLGYKGDQAKCSDTQKNIFYSQNLARNSFYNISDQKIIELLVQGPLMISISSNNWQNYAGGTFRCNWNAKVDHAVLLVGFDQDRWIIKNQWGEDWGENGLIYVTRDKTANCKIGSSVHQLFSDNISCPIIAVILLLLLSLFIY